MSISCRYLNPSWRTNCASLIPGNTVCIPSVPVVTPSTNGGNGANSNNAATPAAPTVYQPPFSPANIAGCTNQYVIVLGDSCKSLWTANNIDQAVFVAVSFKGGIIYYLNSKMLRSAVLTIEVIGY